MICKTSQSTLTIYGLDLLTKSTDWKIAAVGFNSKYSYGTVTPQTPPEKRFLTASNTDYFVCAPTTPTHFPIKQSYRYDVIDIVLVYVPLFTQIQNLNELSFEHN